MSTSETDSKNPDARPQLVATTTSQACCNETWEEAYARFETPAQERRKFHQRFAQLGVLQWPRDTRVLELLCGRGNGLVALQEAGFTNLEGADLSASLLERYQGPARLYLCDCRQLPFENQSHSRIIIQGGLHHLPTLPDDLQRTLAEISRVLSADGQLVLVEPWSTPFLSLVHTLMVNPICRRIYPRLDALAVMTQHEQKTYYNWLSRPQEILTLLHQYFTPVQESFRWGKIMFVGRKK